VTCVNADLTDGGGIRGLSTLKILEDIMERIRREEGLRDTPLPRDHFDLIGGTNTGGQVSLDALELDTGLTLRQNNLDHAWEAWDVGRRRHSSV
jgi:patatin-like phospholipase/acyl hydrolase